jgi:heterodisulfide reductase subunit B
MDEGTALAPEPLLLSSDLVQRVQDELGENVFLCYQCVKCTSGCPLGEFFDWQPNQIMRLVQLGQEETVFQAKTPWLCAACQTCSTRCPQGLDINAIMEFLARESVRRGYPPPVSEVKIFNEAFLREVRLWGRAYELGLMVEMKLRTRDLFSDLDLGVKLVRKRKLAFLPKPTRRPRQTRPVAEAANSIAYYPGCSLHSTAGEFNHSAKAVCTALGLSLVEPQGWGCCGSTAAHRADPEVALRLPLENLALVEQSGFKEMTLPCAACFNRHQSALFEIRNNKGHRRAMDAALEYTYRDSVQVTTLAETILHHAGKDVVALRAYNRLDGLRLVCYYGCLFTRPPRVTGAKHPENPVELDELMTTLGAEVHDWSYKTVCCGAAHSLTRPDIVFKLSSRLIEQACLAGAEAIAVACPLCHTNLDARQFQMEVAQPMPVLYFTQLMAVALGLDEKAAALEKNLVDPRPLLRSKGFIQ